MDDPRHPVGPEMDDSTNPTAASPSAEGPPMSQGEPMTETRSTGGEWTAPPTDDYTTAGERAGESSAAGNMGEGAGARRAMAGRDMLTQLQQMIDTVAVQATPVMRDVAAKAAELAAVAAEKAGPLAHRAAETTERVGARVAARSKEMASELRRQQAESEATSGGTGGSTAATDSTPTATGTSPDDMSAPGSNRSGEPTA